MNPILASLRATLLERGPLAALPDSVWKRTSALNTWGTNAIEGNTLGRVEVERLLLEEHVAAGAPIRDVLETTQHDRAFRSLPHRLDEPLTARLARTLHEDVFRNVAAHAGTWRLIRVGISGTSYVPPRPEEVPGSLDAWEREYHERDLTDAEVLPLAAWMHWRFEAIHPFQDGNGRIGRLLLNFHLLKHNWPPLHVTPDDKKAYTSGLEAGHGGDLEPLTGFLERAAARSVLDLMDQVGSARDELQTLSRLAERGPYDAKYLALRASQGALPAIKVKGAWRTSQRALEMYVKETGRKS